MYIIHSSEKKVRNKDWFPQDYHCTDGRQFLAKKATMTGLKENKFVINTTFIGVVAARKKSFDYKINQSRHFSSFLKYIVQ